MLTNTQLCFVLFISFGITYTTVSAKSYAFFPFHLNNEYERSPDSFVLINVTIQGNASAILLNGLSTTMKTYTTSQSHNVIVFPTMGYYIRSSSSLDVDLQTKVETTTSKYKSIYQVLSDTDLGQTYYLSTIHNTREEFMCTALAPLDKDLNLNITIPSTLIRKISMNKKLVERSSATVRIKKGQVIKFNSSIPLQQVILHSSNSSFSVFCAEKNVRYQLKPSSQCGHTFLFSCEGHSVIIGCRISLTSTTSDKNSLTLFDSRGLIDNISYTGYFFSLNLTNFNEGYALGSGEEVCALITLYSYENDYIWTKVEALSSIGNHTTEIKFESFTQKTIKTHGTNLSAKIGNLTEMIDTTSSNNKSPLVDSKMSTNQQTSSLRNQNQRSSTKLWNIFPFSKSKTLSRYGINPTTKLLKSHTQGLSKLVTIRPLVQTSMKMFNSNLVLQSGFPAQNNAYNYPSTTTSSTSSHSSDLSYHSITRSETVNKSITEGQCLCPVGEYCIEIMQDKANFSSLEEKIIQLQSFLMINKTSLNSFIRRKTCAGDGRSSSRTLGIIGIIVISFCLGSIVACDLLSIFEGRFKNQKT